MCASAIRRVLLLLSAGLFGCDFHPVAPELPQADSVAPELTAAEAVFYGGYSYPRDLGFAAHSPVAVNDHGLVVGVDGWGRFVRNDGGAMSYYGYSGEGWITVEDVNNGGVALVHTGYYGSNSELLWPNGARTSLESDAVGFSDRDYDWYGPAAKAINSTLTVVGTGWRRTRSGLEDGAVRRFLDGSAQSVSRTTSAVELNALHGTDINDANHAVGWGQKYYPGPLEDGGHEAFLWLANGLAFQLVPPSGYGTEFFPTTITNAGVVYGFMPDPMFGTRVVSWSWSAGWRHLLYRHPICNLKASERGRLIFDDCAGGAFTWRNGVTERLWAATTADDVNSCGLIVGRSQGRAVAWDPIATRTGRVCDA